MKQIKLSDTHYIVVDETQEIKAGEYCIYRNSNIHQFEDLSQYGLYFDKRNINKITLSTQPIEGVETYPLSLAKEIAGEVDVESIVKNKIGVPSYLSINSMGPSLQGALELGINCYNQCLEDNKDKKYTEENIRMIRNQFINMCPLGVTSVDEAIQQAKKYYKWLEEYIQSLQPPTEWEVEIIEGKLKRKNP